VFLFWVAFDCDVDVDVTSIVVNATENDLRTDALFDILKKLSKNFNFNCQGDYRGRGVLGSDRP
jgi:hypothetical protein